MTASEMGKKGAQRRWAKLTPRQRFRAMSKVAKARWRKKNGDR